MDCLKNKNKYFCNGSSCKQCCRPGKKEKCKIGKAEKEYSKDIVKLIFEEGGEYCFNDDEIVFLKSIVSQLQKIQLSFADGRITSTYSNRDNIPKATIVFEDESDKDVNLGNLRITYAGKKRTGQKAASMRDGRKRVNKRKK